MARPADMLEQAEAMLQTRVKFETWVEDQHKAAGEELLPTMLRISDSLKKPIIHGQSKTPKEMAFRLALVEAIARRRKEEYTCPHARSTTPPPLLIILGQGVMACKPCLARMVISSHDDGRCDICEELGVRFWPFWCQTGPMLVQGDLCDECKAWGPNGDR